MPHIQNNTIDFKLRKLHPAQERVAKSSAKHKRVRAGRRFGKSLYCASDAVLTALQMRYPVWWVAPTYNNTLAAWKELTDLARQFGKFARIFKSENLIELPGGGSVRVVSGAEPDNVRGSGIGKLILDEAAYVESRLYKEVLLPMLADMDGDTTMISTPRGYNWYYDEYMLGEGSRLPGYESFHFTSYDNPTLKREFLDGLANQMTARAYQQEIMAEFVADALSVFRGVQDCIHYNTYAEPIAGHTYVMGVDWGRKNDYTAISVWDVDERMEVDLDRFTDISFGIQFGRLQALAAKWGVSAINVEENAMGFGNIEELHKRGLPVTATHMTQPSKKRLVELFALAIEQGTVALLDHKEANDELVMFEEEVTQNGVVRYHAPQGRHDDTVIARMLAYDLIGSDIAEPSFLSFL
jgi:hypothetical protein